MKVNITISAVLLYFMMSSHAMAESMLAKAYQYFLDEEYEYSTIIYSNISGFSARMGEGASAYRLTNFKHAIQQYTLALLKAKDQDERYKSLYNLANSYYKDEAFIKAIETYKYLLIYNPDSEQAQGNLWSAQSMLIDKIKNNTLYVDKESVNYDDPKDNKPDDILDKDQKISNTEKIGYLRTLIGDRVSDGELNAIAQNDESIVKLIARATQIKNYLSAVKKLEFVKDNPESILKSIVDFEERQN